MGLLETEPWKHISGGASADRSQGSHSELPTQILFQCKNISFKAYYQSILRCLLSRQNWHFLFTIASSKPYWRIQYKKNIHVRYTNLIVFVQWFSILTMSYFWHILPFCWNLFVALSQCNKGIIELVTKRSKTLFLWPTNDVFVALTQCDKLVLRKWQKKPKKETWSKSKISVL